MADLFRNESADLDISKALFALKKGTQLLKYGRKGKPKVYPFKLSNDESSVIWFSSNGERSLKLVSASRIISGQRTPVFQRYLHPEKDYLSFSLIYKNGKRSLDLICKDRVEAEVRFAGLKALISSGQYGRSKIDGWNDGELCLDVTQWQRLLDRRYGFILCWALRIFRCYLFVCGAVRTHCGWSPVGVRVCSTAADPEVRWGCYTYHVAVLTTRSEVYTWGKGANGRLGHGDIEDRKTPTFVEALKDRPVKRIACGSNFTAAICHHKWVSGAEQSQCSACRQAFGFTRKRHNCNNCGLVHCHSCSPRKAARAALSPNPGKPYRVCDSCYVKLNKVESSGVNSKKNVMPRLSGESKDKADKADIKFSKISSPSNLDLIKNLDIKAAKLGKKSESLSLTGAPQALPLLQLKDVAFGSGIDMHRAIPRPIYTSVVQSLYHSRAVSPVSRKSSPPRSATPIPTISGLSFSRSSADNLKKTNALLCQEVHKLHAQVDSLRQRCELQEFELHKSTKKAHDAIALAAEESAKSKSTKEVIKSLTAQLKDMAERLPYGEYNTIRPMCPSNGIEMHAVHHSNLTGEHLLRNDGSNHSLLSSTTIQSFLTNGISDQKYVRRDIGEANGTGLHIQNHMVASPNGVEEHLNSEGIKSGDMPTSNIGAEVFERKEPEQLQNGDGSKLRSPTSASNHVEGEWIEQYEPGVYITLFALSDGTRDLKRVRFSRR